MTKPARRPNHSGQAMVEFALVSPVFLLFIFGIVDFGAFFTAQNSITDAARAGARYAAVHPSSWSNAAQAPAASIQGAIQQTSGGASVVNVDMTATSGITISYYDTTTLSGTNPTKCGAYSAATGTFVAVTGYTQATCLLAGSTLVEVSLRYRYSPITPYPIPTSTTTFTETTRLVEEQ